MYESKEQLQRMYDDNEMRDRLDAERYRWLKNNILGTKPVLKVVAKCGEDWARVSEIDELDSWIDDYMKTPND